MQSTSTLVGQIIEMDVGSRGRRDAVARDATSRRSLGSHAGLMGMSSSTPVAEVIASAPVVVFAASWSVWKSDFTAPAQDNLTRSQVVVPLL